MQNIIITGKGASGKDLLRRRFQSRGYRYSVSLTTRDPRPGEVNGVDYLFVYESAFREIIKNDNFIEWVEIDGYLFGTIKQSAENCNLFVLSPEGIAQLPKEFREKSVIFYLNIDRESRMDRLLHTHNDDHHYAYHKMKTDDENFKDFKDYDVMITNAKF